MQESEILGVSNEFPENEFIPDSSFPPHSSQGAAAGGEHVRDHMGEHPTNERRPCELRASGAGGPRVGIQTGGSHKLPTGINVWQGILGNISHHFGPLGVCVSLEPPRTVCTSHLASSGGPTP